MVSADCAVSSFALTGGERRSSEAHVRAPQRGVADGGAGAGARAAARSSPMTVTAHRWSGRVVLGRRVRCFEYHTPLLLRAAVAASRSPPAHISSPFSSPSVWYTRVAEPREFYYYDSLFFLDACLFSSVRTTSNNVIEKRHIQYNILMRC